ncbi:MAG: hypothetical protein N3A38_09640 [Planctomycetota bacterium]|nr:hypothetical protein [Planctomycetota bacterium]
MGVRRRGEPAPPAGAAVPAAFAMMAATAIMAAVAVAIAGDAGGDAGKAGGATATGGAEGRPGDQVRPPAAGEVRDPPENQKYSLRVLVWNFWSFAGGMLDGPAGMAESTDLIKGHDSDNAGNLYWTECDAPVIRRYSPKTDRVETIAGSLRGLADGPISRARFGGWTYNSTNLICVSGDGRHLFVRDALGKGLWRYVDLEAGTVTSLGQWHHFKGGYFIIAKDRMGDIYAFVTSGEEPPDCRGYKKLKVAPCLRNGWYAFDRYALDVEKMRFYFHCRGPVTMVDLKTGEGTVITGKGKERPINTSGPLETTVFLCPTGMSLSPAGRFLYVGQGDGSSCYRLDLEKKQALVFGGVDDGGFGWRETGDRKNSCQMTGCTGWPAATVFLPDGRGYWANCWGMYALTPLK